MLHRLGLFVPVLAVIEIITAHRKQAVVGIQRNEGSGVRISLLGAIFEGHDGLNLILFAADG